MESETVLPADPRSAGLARRHVSAALHRWGLHGLVDTAVLLVSELVGNAVRHARTDVRVRVDARPADRPPSDDDRDPGPGVRISVRDYSNDGVAFVRPTPRATGGRGLALLTALSPRWGVTPCPPEGKAVWCDLVDADGRTTGAVPADAAAANAVASDAAPGCAAPADAVSGGAEFSDAVPADAAPGAGRTSSESGGRAGL